MILQAKNYARRIDLENDVRNKIGLTAEAKPEHIIRGTHAELVRLQLSDTTVFWGIKCEITDEPTEIKKQAEVEKVNRGRRHSSGINQNPNEP